MSKKVTLEQLEQLAMEGKVDELQAALKACLFSDLRKFLGALGIKVRTKEYEEVRSKDDHVQLLALVLSKKVAGAGRMDAAVAGKTSSHKESDGAASSKKAAAAKQSERSTVDCLGSFLLANVPLSSKDAERAYLVQCINIAGDALTNAASKEHVPGLKRGLTCELMYYVKRLKRIQDDGGGEQEQDAE